MLEGVSAEKLGKGKGKNRLGGLPGVWGSVESRPLSWGLLGLRAKYPGTIPRRGKTGHA